MKTYTGMEKNNEDCDYTISYTENTEKYHALVSACEVGAEGVIKNTNLEDKFSWLPSEIKDEINESWTDEVISRTEARYRSSVRDPFDVLREERKVKLTELVDEPARVYLNQNLAIPQSILDTRQTLLDLPTTSTPTIDENGVLVGVDWPE